VARNVTVSLREEIARWARVRAAEENLSLSRFVGRMLEAEMRRNSDYGKAYQKWKKFGTIPGLRASERLSREEIHERKRSDVR
jgi:hypothetical protein